MVQASESVQLPALVILGLAVVVLVGAGLLARRNLQRGQGDRLGAARLAFTMAAVLLGVWICRVHLVASYELLVSLLLAVATATFYGVLVWTIYVAFEPFVRRHWPQVLVSWTNVLSGNLRNPIVGRDILVGGAVAMMWVFLIRGSELWNPSNAAAAYPGATEFLDSFRSTAAQLLEQAPYALRNGLAYFLLLYMLRALVRRPGAAALLFASLFAALNAIGSERPAADALLGFVYFGTGAFAVLRWGLLAYIIAAFLAQLAMEVPVTLDGSAWYFGNVLFVLGVIVGLMAWGLYASVGRNEPRRPLGMANGQWPLAKRAD